VRLAGTRPAGRDRIAETFSRSQPGLGIDEKAVGKGQDYESLVYELDRDTVEAVVEERTQANLGSYYRESTAEELGTIRAIARDRWESYILATAACVPDAAQTIVFDRYHATPSVKKETAGSLNLDLVRDNPMPGRGRSA
jgi:transposase